MERLEGWESRLLTAVDSARHEKYILGEHDCFRVACSAVEALTGVDLWKNWAGRYTTRAEAIRLLHDYAQGKTPAFTAAFSRLFGVEPESVKRARRGDIVEFHDGNEPHLGVALATHAAVLRDFGLDFVPLDACRHVWRIG